MKKDIIETLSKDESTKIIKEKKIKEDMEKKAEGGLNEDSEGEIRQPRRRHTLPHLFSSSSSSRLQPHPPIGNSSNRSPSIFDSFTEDSGLESLFFGQHQSGSRTSIGDDELGGGHCLGRDQSMSPFSRIRNDLEQFVEETDKEIEARFLSPHSPRIIFSNPTVAPNGSHPTSPLVGPSFINNNCHGTEGDGLMLRMENLPAGLGKGAIEDMIKDYKVRSVQVQKGVAILKFESIEELRRASNGLNGEKIEGHPVKLEPVAQQRRSSTGSAMFGGTNGGVIGLPNPFRLNPILPGDPPCNEVDVQALRQIFGSLSNTTNNSKIFESQQQQQQQSSSVMDEGIFDLIIPELPPTYFGPDLTPARIRDYRRHIENPACKPSEFDLIAMEMLPVLVAASTDPIGNVLVQKLVERGSEELKGLIIGELAPYLAAIGIHKNGTWVVQKLINWCTLPHHQVQVANALAPYLVALMQDQFGNYVIQCCLQFGEPRNQFIIDGIVQQCLAIGTSRFGARSMRSCLESVHVSLRQQRLAAASILSHAGRLLVDPNGVIVMQWLVDSDLPGRYQSLCHCLTPIPSGSNIFTTLVGLRFASNLAGKLLSQSVEPEARDTMLGWLTESAEQPEGPMQTMLKEPTSISIINKVLGSLPSVPRLTFLDACKRAVSQMVARPTPPVHILRLDTELKGPVTATLDLSSLLAQLAPPSTSSNSSFSEGMPSPQPTTRQGKPRQASFQFEETKQHQDHMKNSTVVFGTSNQLSSSTPFNGSSHSQAKS